MAAGLALWGASTAAAAEPIPTVIDPYTLEPVPQQSGIQQAGFHHHGQGYGYAGPASGGHPVVQSWGQPRAPRHPSIFKDALRDSLSGFYGGVEYMNLYISRPSSQVFGNYTDVPDFSNDDLNGYLAPVGPDPGGANFQAPEQPLRGVLQPGRIHQIYLDPAVVSPANLNPDQFVPNPFYDYVTTGNNLFPVLLPPIEFATQFIDIDDSIVVEGANLIGPSGRDVNFGDMAAIRGTFGYRWDTGIAIEASVFDVERQGDQISVASDLQPRSQLLAFQRSQDLTFVPILVTDLTFDLPADGRGLVSDGDPTDGLTSPDADGNLADLTNALLPLYFDGGFAVDYDIDIGGAESNMLIRLPTTSRTLTLDLMLGARYFNAEESITPALLVDTGGGTSVIASAVQRRPLFDPIDLGAATYPNYTWDSINGLPELGEVRNMSFSSITENNVYAAQLGLRSELNLGWCTFGVAPKLALGVNDAGATVTTSQLFRATDPTLSRNSSWQEFAAIFDVGVYARMQVREWLHATVGYQLMAVDGLAHAPDVIDWTASTADPALGVREDSGNLIVQGLTLGFEVIFP